MAWLCSVTNLRVCEDQSWLKVQAVPVFRFDLYNMISCTPYDDFEYPWWYVYPRLKTTDLEYVGASTSHNPINLHSLLQGWLVECDAVWCGRKLVTFRSARFLLFFFLLLDWLSFRR
jgi:hypothetical protein